MVCDGLFAEQHVCVLRSDIWTPKSKSLDCWDVAKIAVEFIFFSHWKNTKRKEGVFNNLITLAFTYLAYADSNTQLKKT